MSDQASLAYWWPRLLASGVAVPRTEVVQLTDEEHGALVRWALADTEDRSAEAGQHVMVRLTDALGQKVPEVGGYPVFLRTGHGSGKHEWKNTCYIDGPGVIGQHVWNLLEWSQCVDFFGLPCDVWAVRELLPTKPAFRAFRGMPVTEERRYFFRAVAQVDAQGKERDVEVLCRHPYWPPDAFEDRHHDEKLPEHWRDALHIMSGEDPWDRDELVALTLQVAQQFEGAWSLDWLRTERGWVAIDMAPAELSWHWPGCSVAKERGWTDAESSWHWPDE